MDEQHAEHGDVFAERRDKLAAWRETGAAYPTKYQPRDEIGSLQAAYESLEAGQDSPDVRRIAGRVVARRVHGKLTFVVLKDLSGELQLFCQLDALGDERYAALEHVDLGDFVGAEGAVMRTRRGELSLRITSWQLLSKSLRPMPEKYHGLTDVETRYRKRYLDLAANDDSREVFVKRARIIAAIRRFLDDRGFVEVETPVLQPLYGGALAKPFVTHHNELERDLYLRIATELYLKRCIIGGIDRVYEIGKDFRNEGVSFKHNPEFTMLETYEAYVDYNHVMTMVEEMTAEAARAVGALQVTFREHEIDLTPPWPRLTMRKAIESETGIDIGADDARTVGRPSGAHQGEGARRRRAARPGLGRPGRRPVQRVRRAQAHPAGVHHRAPARDQPVRQEDPARPALRRALRGLHRRHGAEQRLQRAQRPRRPARALRCSRCRTSPTATRPRTGSTRTSSRPWSTACRPPAASAWASTAS